MDQNKNVAPATGEEKAAEARRLVAEFGQRIEREHNAPGEPQGPDTERNANIAIEARSIDYANAEAAAKHEKLAKAPRGDISARLDVMREPEPELIPPEVARKWAETDLADFRKLQANQDRQEDAAIEIMQNAKRNALYASALKEAAPDVYERAALADAANEQRIALKEVRKDAEARAMPPEMALDPAAMERLAKARGRDMAEARESLGLNSVAPDVEREKQQLPAEQDAARSAWLRKGDQPKQSGPSGAPLDNKVESDEVFSAKELEVKPIVPADVEKQYTRVGDKFYHPKHKDLVAFEDRGNRLETKSDSDQIAESMVRIAQARGWDEIKVTGSETFRREAWIEAASRGMHVKGYEPNEQDKVELAKRLKESGANRVEKDEAQFRARENEPSADGHTKASNEASKSHDMATAFATKTPAEAVKAYPELAGAEAAVAAAEKQVGKDGLTPEAKAIVMARVRQNVTNAIERGDLPEVKVTEERTVQQETEKEMAR